MLRRLGFVAALIASTVGLAGATVRAEQPGVFEVVISGDSLGMAASQGLTLGQHLVALTGYADGTPCVRADVSAVPAVNVFLEFGLPGQPAACSTDGAVVTFVDTSGRWLSEEMTLVTGTRETLTNLAPVPPGSPSGSIRPEVTPQTPLIQPASPPVTILPPDTGSGGLAAKPR